MKRKKMTIAKKNKYMNHCYVIAEAGVNHNGDLSKAIEMIEAAANAGADAIKFQTFKAENLVSLHAKTAQYQKDNAGHENQYEMLKSLELSYKDYTSLIQKSSECKIEFMSTPFEEESLDFLIGLGMKKIKVASGEITNLPFLRYMATKNLPIILSTGMSSIEEIQEAIATIHDERMICGFDEPLQSILTILHCTSNYPCPLADANLRAITTIKETFFLPIGYSDHTVSLDVALVCMGLGMSVYEKHFTLDKNLPGPDHKASLDPQELKEVIAKIRRAELSLGNGEKRATPEELDVRKLVRKSIVLVVNKEKGALITRSDIRLLRPGTGLPPKDMDQVISAKTARNLTAGTMLEWSDLSL
jgi:N,N'-diacetyllegionaminate synthase